MLDYPLGISEAKYHNCRSLNTNLNKKQEKFDVKSNIIHQKDKEKV